MANEAENSDVSLVKSIAEKVRGCEIDRIQQPQTIHTVDRVPAVFREQNQNAYTPTIVSIGPVHRGATHLKAMEPVKLSYTRALFNRTGAAFEETLRTCVAKLLNDELEFLKSFYVSSGLKDSGSLAEVILIDGCFIIELLKRFVYLYPKYDPILSDPYKLYAVTRDLLLLENQIPFRILTILFNTLGSGHPVVYPLHTCIIMFFGGIMGGKIKVPEATYSGQDPHILGLLRSYYTEKFIYEGSKKKVPSSNSILKRRRIKYSAIELRLGGVELKAAGTNFNNDLFNIKFSKACSWSSCCSLFKKGHLEIPPFRIDDSTEIFLRNVIAFELSCPEIPSYFTSFAFLMDLLINTAEDVKLFEEAGIIRNYLDSREEVTQLFNGICKNAISIDFFHYSSQYHEAMDFCTPWRVSTGRLKHHYFGSTWAGISVIAGLFLFVLTFLSTIYTMLSYYVGDTGSGLP